MVQLGISMQPEDGSTSLRTRASRPAPGSHEGARARPPARRRARGKMAEDRYMTFHAEQVRDAYRGSARSMLCVNVWAFSLRIAGRS